MNFGYVIYDSAIEKLRNSGLLDRIKNTEGRPYFLTDNYDEAEKIVNDLKARGYYKSLPTEFYSRIQNALENDSPLSWTLEKPEGKKSFPFLIEDLLLLAGGSAHHILSPKEFSKCKEFGFDSTEDLFLVLGAYIQAQDPYNMRKGYKWDSKNGDAVRRFEIAATVAGDMTLTQKDARQYPVLDAFGNRVSVRPLEDIEKGIYAYHDTEGPLLFTVLQYMKQEGIKAEVSFDKGEQKGGSLFGDFGFDERPFFTCK